MRADVDQLERSSVLAVELGEEVEHAVRRAAKGAELTVTRTTVPSAIQRFARDPSPGIVVFEWHNPRVSEEVCSRLVYGSSPERFYAMALALSGEPGSVREALEAPVNDVVFLPVSRELLLVRLQRGVRFMDAARTSRGPRRVLEEALISEEGGEVAVRAAGVVARVHVRNGAVVWAHLSSAPVKLEDLVIAAGAPNDPELFAALKDECRRTRAHFMDVLVRWGVLTEERARETLRAFTAARLEAVLELPGASAFFIPSPGTYGGPVSVRAEEASAFLSRRDAAPVSHSRRRESVPYELASPGEPAPPCPPFAGALLDAAAKVDGADSALLFHLPTRQCLMRRGAEVDGESLEPHLRALQGLGLDGGEILAGGANRSVITRSVPGAPSLALVVALSSGATMLGLARAQIAQIRVQLDE
ncbi:MAG: hypothetical protein R3B70_48160 [Polyangiaceae bacterium]